MNPIYTGKDVSFIDTKQAQRLAECKLADAETMAALASLGRTRSRTGPSTRPGANWFSVPTTTGSPGRSRTRCTWTSLGGWREAFELAGQVEEHSRQQLVAAIDTSARAPAARGHGRGHQYHRRGPFRLGVRGGAGAAGRAGRLGHRRNGGSRSPSKTEPGEPSARWCRVSWPPRYRGSGTAVFGYGYRAGSASAGGWSEAPGPTSPMSTSKSPRTPSRAGAWPA